MSGKEEDQPTLPCLSHYFITLVTCILSSVSPTRLQLHKGKEHICLIPRGLPSTWHTECSINTWGTN